MLDVAYRMGAQKALEDFQKEAWLSSALALGKGLLATKPVRAAKFLMGIGGHRADFIGAPLGGALLGAAMADPGERLKGFAGGAVGGLGASVGFMGGTKLLKGMSNSIGKRIGATPQGAKVWGGLGKVNPEYGARRLAKHEEAAAKGLADHKELLAKAKPGEVIKPFVPPKFTGDAAHSFGQHAVKQWLPGAAGVAGGLGGALYFGTKGDELGQSLAPDIGDFTQRSMFNPVRR